MSNDKYYDGTKLLSLLDIENNKPEIYIVTTNRTGGKTVYFSRMLVNRYKKNNSKFAILYRYNYELDDCADKFFKDIKRLFFPNDVMTSRRKASGIYHELFINEQSCGYAISINSADVLKKYAHLFSDVDSIMFDEFQPEDNKYCPNEVRKFISIHTSIARGNGEQYRYVPVYMISNPVTLINPYYIELGISNRLQEGTKFLKGNGFVLEQGYVESAALSQQQGGFNKAFSSNEYIAYSTQCIYLNDNKTFIEKVSGKSNYVVTLKYNNKQYAIREFSELGIMYCDTNVDFTFPHKITVTTDDHEINYIMLKQNNLFLSSLRFYFEKGCFRFKDLQCKEAVLKALSY